MDLERLQSLLESQSVYKWTNRHLWRKKRRDPGGELQKKETGPAVRVSFYYRGQRSIRMISWGKGRSHSHSFRLPSSCMVSLQRDRTKATFAQSKSQNPESRVQLEHSEQWRTCDNHERVHMVTSCCTRPMRSLKILWTNLPIKTSYVFFFLLLCCCSMSFCSCCRWQSWLESTNGKVLKNSQGDCVRTLLFAAYSSFASAVCRW